MALSKREVVEQLIKEGQDFVQLSSTPQYANTIAKWIEEELGKPVTIDVSAIDPANLQNEYWMLMGRQRMLYDFINKIRDWRKQASMSADAIPDLDETT